MRPALLLALLAAAPSALADSIRCDGGIVAVGETKLDLLGKCGLPTLRETVNAERAAASFGRGGFVGDRVEVTVERWSYNFGPSRFVMHVELEGGRVRSIERGSYGYDLGEAAQAAPIWRARCDALSFKVGDRTFDVLVRCGEPVTRDLRRVTRAVGGRTTGSPGVLEGASETVLLEVWAYDFGPRTLVRVLEFEDGVLRRVETGGYGYAR